MVFSNIGRSGPTNFGQHRRTCCQYRPNVLDSDQMLDKLGKHKNCNMDLEGTRRMWAESRLPSQHLKWQAWEWGNAHGWSEVFEREPFREIARDGHMAKLVSKWGLLSRVFTTNGLARMARRALSGIVQLAEDEHVRVAKACEIARSPDDASFDFVRHLHFLVPEFPLSFPGEPGRLRLPPATPRPHTTAASGKLPLPIPTSSEFVKRRPELCSGSRVASQTRRGVTDLSNFAWVHVRLTSNTHIAQTWPCSATSWLVLANIGRYILARLPNARHCLAQLASFLSNFIRCRPGLDNWATSARTRRIWAESRLPENLGSRGIRGSLEQLWTPSELNPTLF